AASLIATSYRFTHLKTIAPVSASCHDSAEMWKRPPRGARLGRQTAGGLDDGYRNARTRRTMGLADDPPDARRENRQDWRSARAPAWSGVRRIREIVFNKPAAHLESVFDLPVAPNRGAFHKPSCRVGLQSR